MTDEKVGEPRIEEEKKQHAPKQSTKVRVRSIQQELSNRAEGQVDIGFRRLFDHDANLQLSPGLRDVGARQKRIKQRSDDIRNNRDSAHRCREVGYETSHPSEFDSFVDFAIDDDLSEGDTNIDLMNDNLMRDEQTGEIRVDASRGKLKVSNGKKALKY